MTDDPSIMANYLVNSFASVFNPGDCNSIYQNQMCDNDISHLVFFPGMVEEILLSLDANSSVGGDGIHPRLLKSLAKRLSIPLCIIFNNSLNCGQLPNSWKKSIVVPIFKKGSRLSPLNYRPVSLTSVSCKTMERLIVAHLMTYVSDNSIISKDQFGFRKFYSTADQLLITYNEVTDLVDKGKSVDLIFFDFAKAFDTVCHRVLLFKLLDLGICGNILSWIHGFLTNRTMSVKVAGSFSDELPVASGVPQGSVLGPILFLLYVNYVINDVRCPLKIFADDIKLYISFGFGEHQESVVQCQSDIDRSVSVSSSWGLNMNVSKCTVIRFSSKSSNLSFSGPSPCKINNSCLNFDNSHTDLGVTVDRTLKFHSHIAKNVAIAGSLTTNLHYMSVP